MNQQLISFKTSDGVDIHPGDLYWYIAQGHGGKLKKYRTSYTTWQDYNKGPVNFSTEELADKYLKEQTPDHSHH